CTRSTSPCSHPIASSPCETDAASSTGPRHRPRSRRSARCTRQPEREIGMSDLLVAERDTVRVRPRSSRMPLAIAAPQHGIAGFGRWWIDGRTSVGFAGLDAIARLIARMLLPARSEPGYLIDLILQSLWIAIAGTGMATIGSLFLGAAACRSYR